MIEKRSKNGHTAEDWLLLISKDLVHRADNAILALS
jgi:hypothetical protein